MSNTVKQKEMLSKDVYGAIQYSKNTTKPCMSHACGQRDTEEDSAV